MKNNDIKIFCIAATIVLSSCIKMMDEAGDAKTVEPVTVSYKISATTGFTIKGEEPEPDPSFPVSGLKATFVNFKEGIRTDGIVAENGLVTMTNLIPGVYTIDVSGTVEKEGQTYYLNGAAQNVSLIKSISQEQASTPSKEFPGITIRPSRVGPLCISEIYYCGIASFYFRDQTYQIYNNGDEVCYLDSLCFAQLNPSIATATLPVYPDEDGFENFVYGIVVWQIPGTGKDYPLQPGESIIIVQESKDHTSNNPNSFNNSKSEWEAWSGNAGRDNPDVPNIPYIFWHTPNSLQWLASVNGAAYCIYKSNERLDAEYWEKPSSWQTEVNKPGRLAKIPADQIIDGVELLPSMDALDKKRIPGFVDAGGASVGATYIGKTVSRKVTGQRGDGTPIFSDTNNSTNDFEINDHPALRRHGDKVPSWSPSK